MPESTSSPSPDGAPRADQRPFEQTHHSHLLVDPYHWLADPDDAATLPHLEAENRWTEAATVGQDSLRAAIFEEIKVRTKEDDTSVPVRDGDWWYFSRTAEGLAYPIACRRAYDESPDGRFVGSEQDQVVLDPNQLVAEGEYLGIGYLEVSPDGNLLAYALDREGDERHVLRFRDLRSGEDSGETVVDAAYGFAWAADSRTCWYTLQDDQSRPDRVLRHVVGTRPADDVEVFSEPDERFHVQVEASLSGDVAVIGAGSAITSESWLLDAHRPDEAPIVVCVREHGIEYGVAHHPRGLFVVSNHGEAEDFALWRAPLEGLTTADRADWELVMAHEPGTRLSGVEALVDHAVIYGRCDGVSAVWVLDLADGGIRRLATDEDAGTLGPGANAMFATSQYRLTYQSLVTPASVIDEDLPTGERVVLKQQPVLGGFDQGSYESTREWAVAADGTRVPISLVWRPDRIDPDGPNPCVLYGYGAYEASMDPWFSVARLSLLDRGVVFALAHVRGGGEMGRRWYEDGKFGAKANSFTDFVGCAQHLVDTGWTAPERLAARGASAGGLLMGAVTNLAPDLFRVVVAEVPFVDPLNTMLDPSLPLTVIEREEWGDPMADAAAYGWLRGYSPYENISPAIERTYPALLATAGLTDPRVGYHEPAKWVARLRDLGHGTDPERPVLLKVEMGAGHGGPTGRYDSWRDEAWVLAFILDALGVRG